MTAAEFLEQHEWCQFTKAKNTHGCAVRVGDSAATQFCLAGAMLRAYPGLELCEAWAKVRAHLNGVFPTTWNDAPGRTKAEVVALLRKAGV